jgi:hypothetical protein
MKLFFDWFGVSREFIAFLETNPGRRAGVRIEGHGVHPGLRRKNHPLKG